MMIGHNFWVRSSSVIDTMHGTRRMYQSLINVTVIASNTINSI
jgi:hypothetical protein